MNSTKPCPLCDFYGCYIVSTTNEWRNYCLSCDVRFNDDGEVMNMKNVTMDIIADPLHIRSILLADLRQQIPERTAQEEEVLGALTEFISALSVEALTVKRVSVKTSLDFYENGHFDITLMVKPVEEAASTGQSTT